MLLSAFDWSCGGTSYSATFVSDLHNSHLLLLRCRSKSSSFIVFGLFMAAKVIISECEELFYLPVQPLIDKLALLL
jgi:hypothetical protein